MKRDVEFLSSDGCMLRGYLKTPDGKGPFPTVAMAHGFSAIKEVFLEQYADVFTAHGLACLVYDHRNLGASDGEPRFEVDPWAQMRGYRDALTFASLQPECDESRLGVWGTSYSGGHVIPVAAVDKRVKAVVSQVPFISGLANCRRVYREEELPVLREMFDADRKARMQGEEPKMLDVFGERGSLCALPSPEEWDFMHESGMIGTPMWLNKVTLRSAELFFEYEPGRFIEEISPTPLLMILVSHDLVTPQDIALDAYARAREPKQLLMIQGGHMDIYIKEFERGSAAAAKFLAEHLGV